MTENDNVTAPETAVVVHGTGAQVVAFGTRAQLDRLGERISDLPGPLVRAARNAVSGAGHAVSAGAEMSGAYLKLTPQAQQLLASHDQASTTAGLLGFVRAGDGKIAGQLTFEPAAGALSAAPALAGAAALQLQMAAIEQRLDAIQSDLGYLIKERTIEVEAQTAANLEILSAVYAEVMTTGELRASQWDRVVNIEASVRQVFHQASLHLASIQVAVDQTEGSLGERVRALHQLVNDDRTEQWLQLYIHADRAITEWELLYLYRQLDEHPDRVEELADALRVKVIQRFEVLRGLADALASQLEAEHGERWYDRFRLVSRSRLENLLLELGQILYSYQQGVAQIGVANSLALSASDVACEGLDVLAILPVSTESSESVGLKDAVADTLSKARARIPTRREIGQPDLNE